MLKCKDNIPSIIINRINPEVIRIFVNDFVLNTNYVIIVVDITPKT